MICGCKHSACVIVNTKIVCEIVRCFITYYDRFTMLLAFLFEIYEARNNKKVADKKSQEAKWVTLKELVQIGKTDKNGLRGDELLEWGTYLENGGQIYPLSMFGYENAD